MDKPAELNMQQRTDDEMPDLSTGAFRFISVLLAATGILLLAGVL